MGRSDADIADGSSGQIGSALRPLLEKHGSVVAPSSDTFDLSQPEALAEQLKGFKPISLSIRGYTRSMVRKTRPNLRSVSCRRPARIAQWPRAVAFRCFISRPTMFLMDREIRRGARGAAPGRFRCMARASLRDAAVQAANGPHLIVRTSWVYAAKGTNSSRRLFGWPARAGHCASFPPDRRTDNGKSNRQRV